MLVHLAFRPCPGSASSTWSILRVRVWPNRRSLRRVSSSARARNPYPFPTSQDPTPYQIFHLMPDASHADIKQRYYELVKLYHPDSIESRRREPDAARRHTQFSAITRAYARLQKRAAGEGVDTEGAEGMVNPFRRAPTMNRRRYEEPRFIDDRWKDRMIWGILGFSFVSVAAQTIVIRRKRFQDVTDQLHSGEAISIALTSNDKTSEEDALRLRRPKQS